MKTLTPKEIVGELDKYIVGQDKAKKMVAIALRNRWRRQRLPEDLREEVAPKNIIMIGPTGVGKTEVARRLASLASAPFLKIEASKFTEVGYVGRDVESMIRELTDLAVNMVKAEKTTEVQERAARFAEERILDLLLPSSAARPAVEDSPVEADEHIPPTPFEGGEQPSPRVAALESTARTREKLRLKLEAGELEERYVEVEVKDSPTMPMMQIFSSAGIEEMDINLQDMLGRFLPQRTKRRKAKVSEVRKILTMEETQKLIDMDEVVSLALERVENHGIIFLDEIDKIASKGGGSGSAPDVSREGVQRDILPIVEGCHVPTKYGSVRTDHILFIAAGAFHMTKPSDLIPELQGRFPIRVELSSLSANDFLRILTEPKNALIRQYVGLLATEGVRLEITEDAVREIADSAFYVNEQTENIGARRLHTIMERVLEDISFEAPTRRETRIKVDAQYVRERLKDILRDRDLSRYIL